MPCIYIHCIYIYIYKALVYRKLHFLIYYEERYQKEKRRYRLSRDRKNIYRRERVLNLSEMVKRYRSSFTNFQFDHFERRSKPLYSRRIGNLHRLSRYFPL